MLTAGPYNLTIGTPLILEDPGANSNNPAIAVQIQNASPFLIFVDSGAQRLAIQSFTAQTIVTGLGQPTNVNPEVSNQAGTTTAADVLTAVWLLAGEYPPMADGPLTAAAIIFGLEGAGIAGAGVISHVWNVPATGGPISAGLSNASYQLWDWGFFTPTAGGGTVPTKGHAVLSAVGGGGSALDAINYLGGGSSRLAGLKFTITGGGTDLAVTSYLDQQVEAFIDYSVI